ncbi:uncharacterized protein PG986_008570 [Apiospora aurea]|uniref:Zn(2)-C6 fungal-type domain-containing protein n=1 Tax=Apiospora aurea TaxID=335848 RepID=A0ABR1QFT8_9PEZI
MKRKAEGGAAQPSRRQPQVSCDSCRRKKLKCDRGQPCGSCHIRGLACTTPASAPGTSARDDHVHGPTTAASAESDATIKSLLARVAVLEQTVYRGGAAPAVCHPSSHPTPAASKESSFSPPSPHSALDNERRQETKFLDSAIDRSKLVSKDSPAKYQITRSGSQQSPTWLMSRKEALALFHDFVDNAYHLLHILQMDATRLIIHQFYDRIETDIIASASPDHAALILGIAATTAFFWDARVPCQHPFESEKAAQQAALTWRLSALDLLGVVQKSGIASLEAAQAYAIIAYLYYNVDGQSAQFRLLHAGSVAACRELSMHLVDGPGGGSDDDAAIREVKRRLWWHVAATDWMLAQCGGPLDGTYTIHPRHMSVAKPRNLNDSDLALAVEGLTHPPEVPTQMSCFLQRIRLAEACRAVVDGYLPGQAEISDYGQVLDLDQLFEQILVTSPPCLALSAPVPPGAPRLLCLQRATVHLGFHSRRARLHRPFLMRKDADGRPGDVGFHQSRELCIQSARTVLEISMALLGQSLSEPPDLEQQRMPHILSHANHEQCPGSPVHRLGIVINHLFTACAILALGSSVRTNRVGDGEQNNEKADGDVQDALTSACRLLAAAGKESPVAADLVRGLTGVLRRYRIQVKGVGKWAEGSGPEFQDAEAGRTSRNDVRQAEDPPCLESDVGAGHGTQPVENDAVENFGLDNLWDDFLGSERMSEDWEQIVTGLDSYYMPQFG